MRLEGAGGGTYKGKTASWLKGHTKPGPKPKIKRTPPRGVPDKAFVPKGGPVLRVEAKKPTLKAKTKETVKMPKAYKPNLMQQHGVLPPDVLKRLTKKEQAAYAASLKSTYNT